MAMTKAEKAEMRALRERAALNWSDEPPRKDMSSARRDQPMQGWLFNSYIPEVSQGEYDGYLHVRKGRIGDARASASRDRGGPWFHTRLDALKAMRAEMVRQAAKKLADIDEKIEAEMKESTHD